VDDALHGTHIVVRGAKVGGESNQVVCHKQPLASRNLK
jgi:hypothetical protein